MISVETLAMLEPPASRAERMARHDALVVEARKRMLATLARGQTHGGLPWLREVRGTIAT